MQKNLLFIGLFLYSALLSAQYGGGYGDGVDAARAWQLDLEGIPSGVRPLYFGGRDDGYASGRTVSGLNGTAQALALYTGGRGDGFARQVASTNPAGFDFAQIYGGGAGDGFDGQSGSFTADGATLVALFSGGDGDGYTGLQHTSAADGTEIAQLYGGGPGDGYALFTAGELLGMPMTMLYKGGTGDGYDQHANSLALDGQDLTALFGGATGDGFSYAAFYGVLPLPLTLISFDAFPEEQYVLLRWVTEDEIATDFFTIEKTRSGRDFVTVGDLSAAGYSRPGEQLEYELKDPEPYGGTSYYRLKTTDFDGSISLSQLVAVHFQSRREWGFQLFPNPNTGQHFNLSLEGVITPERLSLEVSDANGRIIYRGMLDGDLQSPHRFDLNQRLAPGSYLIRVNHPGLGSAVKILIVGR